MILLLIFVLMVCFAFALLVRVCFLCSNIDCPLFKLNCQICGVQRIGGKNSSLHLVFIFLSLGNLRMSNLAKTFLLTAGKCLRLSFFWRQKIRFRRYYGRHTVKIMLRQVPFKAKLSSERDFLLYLSYKRALQYVGGCCCVTLAVRSGHQQQGTRPRCQDRGRFLR